MDEPPCHVINNDLSPVAKGKRTKRLRPQSPATSYRLSASVDDGAATEEEQDIARCLILLAQGYFSNDTKNNSDTATDKGGGGAAVYACKTCDRVFSSFQALGGHRTSHKKPKIDDDFSSKKRTPPPHTLSLQLSSFTAGKPYASPRIHECSYCGAEFTSGQALGGHMRRHRAVPICPVPSRIPDSEPNKPRNGLSLDLNFPAPEDKFEFGSGRPENLMVATNTPALVDCHF